MLGVTIARCVGNFSDAAKAEAIKAAYGYAERKARMKVSDYKISDTDLRAYIVEKEGIPYSSFALYRASLPKDPTKYDVAAAINKLSISEEQKGFLWDLHYGKVKSRL